MASQPPDDVTKEFATLKEAGTSDNATINGVLTSLSTMKKGKTSNFFHANLTNGKTKLRLVGFQDMHRKRLASLTLGAHAQRGLL